MFAAAGANQIVSVQRSAGVLRGGRVVFREYGDREFIPAMRAPPGRYQAEMSRTLMALRSTCGRYKTRITTINLEGLQNGKPSLRLDGCHPADTTLRCRCADNGAISKRRLPVRLD